MKSEVSDSISVILFSSMRYTSHLAPWKLNSVVWFSFNFMSILAYLDDEIYA